MDFRRQAVRHKIVADMTDIIVFCMVLELIYNVSEIVSLSIFRWKGEMDNLH